MATTTERDDRRQAKSAIRAARKAEREAGKLARQLPKGGPRAKFEAIVADAATTRRAAEADRDAAPRRAARRAARASAKLERASLRMGPSGSVGKARATPKDTDAESRAKARAKTLKRRRKQAQQVQKMAKSVALRTVVQSVTTPTEKERAKRDMKLLQRRAKRVAIAADRHR
jgi:hypothetical protein